MRFLGSLNGDGRASVGHLFVYGLRRTIVFALLRFGAIVLEEFELSCCRTLVLKFRNCSRSSLILLPSELNEVAVVPILRATLASLDTESMDPSTERA